MASYNRVMLMGNLTRDIELRYTPGGTAVMDNAVAVNDRRKSASGEWVEETTFVDVTFWGRTAEVASEYLSKGSPIFVEGRLKLDTWETDGQKRSKLRVVCDRMQMLGSPGGGSSGSNSSGGSTRRSSRDDEYGEHDSGSSKGRSASGTTSQSASHAAHSPTTGGGPTGDGPGYDEPDIPF